MFPGHLRLAMAVAARKGRTTASPHTSISSTAWPGSLDSWFGWIPCEYSVSCPPPPGSITWWGCWTLRMCIHFTVPSNSIFYWAPSGWNYCRVVPRCFRSRGYFCYPFGEQSSATIWGLSSTLGALLKVQLLNAEAPGRDLNVICMFCLVLTLLSNSAP